MTQEELSKHLLTKLDAEIEDTEGYYKMSEIADTNGQFDLATGLFEMAKDEYSHVLFIESVIYDMDIEMSKDTKEKLASFENKFKELFL